MGQKTHPIGFRLGISKTWRSQWYANRDFPALLREDELLRKYLKARLGHAAIVLLVLCCELGREEIKISFANNLLQGPA